MPHLLPLCYNISNHKSMLRDEMPKISAVMPLYNTPFEYLSATVESILNQTFADFELIIIDDASTVEYKEFFEQFKDERIKYFKLEKNAGPGHARNEGINKATGEYVALVDSDDISLPERFKLQAEFLDKNPEISILGTSFRFSNRKNPALTIYKEKEIRNFILFNSPLCNPTIMFRRDDMIKKNLFFDKKINFAEDYKLWIDAAFAGLKMANLKELLLIYTRRSGQLSKEKEEIQISILKDLYKEIFAKLGFEATKEEIDLHYNIESENFNQLTTKQISDWFDKIITSNQAHKIFDEEKLIERKKQTIDKYNKIKNRLFKIKIGNQNLCLNTNLRIYLEERN